MKFTGMEKLRKSIDDSMKTDIKKLVYELSDGRSSPDIAQETGVDETTIRDYWKAWAYLGLVEIHPDYKKRYRKLFSLTEFGIEIPKTKDLSDLNKGKVATSDDNGGKKVE
jgi:transposase